MLTVDLGQVLGNVKESSVDVCFRVAEVSLQLLSNLVDAENLYRSFPESRLRDFDAFGIIATLISASSRIATASIAAASLSIISLRILRS